MKMICPVCSHPLLPHGRSAVCANRHSFDYAASGYLNLLMGKSANRGDSAEMTAARTAFLNSGAYSRLREEICTIMTEYGTDVTVDVCCGEGYYTGVLPGREKYGIDLSKPALKYAAKRDPSTQYILASAFRIPLEDDCADAVLTCFAPAAVGEIRRILKPGGVFIYVTGGKQHLWELKELLYDHVIANEDTQIETDMELIGRRSLEYVFHSQQPALGALFAMTPYAYHTGEDGQERIRSTDALDITADFDIRIWRKPSAS